MKKAFLGLGVLGIYALYSLGIRHQQPQIAKPAATTSGNQGGTAANSNNTSSSSTATSASNAPSSSSASNSSTYRDGNYSGSTEDAYYGNVQVAVTISGGRVTDVKFLQYPNSHSTSVYINQQAMPYLQQEAIQNQSSNVQIISGATFTSQAFIQSLQNALNKA